jgi:glyoxalase family protein
MDFNGIIKGLHHVTAVVNDAQQDYHFYTHLLGMRLVKQTVNFENEKVYHFYYANKSGAPSTVFTTFPYQGQDIRQGVRGAGQVTHTALSIPQGQGAFWKDRLTKHQIDYQERSSFGQLLLDFKDPAGLSIQLVESVQDERAPIWVYGDITEKEAIRGIHHVEILVNDGPETIPFLEAFGYNAIEENGDRVLFETNEGGAGNRLIMKEDLEAKRGKNGIGVVHHVAHRVATEAQLRAIKEAVESEYGKKVTDVLDRKYFKSIYFRIPGGVLFEVATTEPGFTVDEPITELGSSLQLPEWQEARRAEISQHLPRFKH